MDIAGHVAKRRPTRNRYGHLCIKHLKSNNFKFLKVIRFWAGKENVQ